MSVPHRPILILYGSQTGCAQEVAERIHREAKRLHFKPRISSMDDYDVRHLIRENLVAFVCSTTGQGDEPDNMKKFWRFLLRRSLPSDSLKSMRFGVLGLGDSSYPRFNFAAKRLHRRLVQLGAIAVANTGLADDQHDHGPDAVVDPWIGTFWERALEILPLPEGVVPIPKEVRPESRFIVTFANDNNAEDTNEEEPSHFFMCPMTKNERLTSASHFQDTRLIEFDISGMTNGAAFNPGDVCEVRPNNLSENVEQFFELFPKLDRNSRLLLRLREDDDDDNVTKPVKTKTLTLAECAESLWDLQSIPKRYFFELLSHFTPDETEREKLVEFTTAEGQEDLYNYCNRPRRNVLEVLYDFPHAADNVPLEYLFDLFTNIRPRPFSIASSAKAIPGRLQLLVAVVRYKSSLVRPRLGLCSNWLARMEVGGGSAPILVKKGGFDFGVVRDRPLVMVGPGTGIAPFRSYVMERVFERRQKAEITNSSSDLAVFFGCRGQKSDFYFSEEWSEILKDNDDKSKKGFFSFHFHPAFSRDQQDKVYVQHLILKQEFLLRKLVWEEKGGFFLAGNSKQMPDQVVEALKRALRETVGLDEEKVEEYFKKMVEEKRYQAETWA